MLGRRQVANEENIRMPGEVLRILRAGDQKPIAGASPGWLNQQRSKRPLTIGRIGAEIGQIGSVMGDWRHRPMHVRIDMTVERQDQTGAQPLAKLGECRTARVAEYNIEISEA